MKRIWRSFLFWLRNLWRKFPLPSRFSVSKKTLKKAWKPVLQEIDRLVNAWTLTEKFPEERKFRMISMLLAERKIMIAQRRAGKLPQEVEG